MIEIIEADSSQVEIMRGLFREYADWLKVDLCFQDFERELRELPGEYAPPSGCLLLAMEESEAVGCIALRKITDDTCEMKRLYVRKIARGRGLGRRLCERLMSAARAKGYAKMRLDTLPSMREAISLYRSFGAREIEPYRYNPVGGALFFEIKLETSNEK